MSQFAYSQLREGIGQEPGVATALTVIGAGIAVIAGLIGAASIFVPFANNAAPELSSLVIPGAGTATGLILIGLATIIKDVRVMRLIVQYDSEEKAEEMESDKKKAS